MPRRCGARTSFEESIGRLGVTRLAGLRFHDIPDAHGPLTTTDKLTAAAAAPDGMFAGALTLTHRRRAIMVARALALNAMHPSVCSRLLLPPPPPPPPPPPLPAP